MVPVDVILDDQPISEEFNCDLKDSRRTERLKKISNILMEHPEESYPDAFSNPSALESLYRFTNNNNIQFSDVIKGHQEATAERASKLKEVVIIHDTTECSWPKRENWRWGLCKLSSRRQGFWFHTSIVTTADGFRCPLGCIHARGYIKEAGMQSTKELTYWKKSFGVLAKKQHRWQEGVEKSEHTLSGKTSAIHVMDSEGDDYSIFNYMLERKKRFVVRFQHDRKVELDDNALLNLNMTEALKKVPVKARRTIQLSERTDTNRRPHDKQLKPARNSRKAKVLIRGCSLKIKCPSKHENKQKLPSFIRLNLVEISETQPPSGEKPVHWILLTTESIDNRDAILKVVDIYRTRWLTEEYYKAIKTGCSYSKRQLETANSLLLALAITLPIAWRLLVIRHMERTASHVDATSVISNVQLVILQHHLENFKWSRRPTVSEAMRAIARLGGHLPQNGSPGWQTLGRGYIKLLSMETGWKIAMSQNILQP